MMTFYTDNLKIQEADCLKENRVLLIQNFWMFPKRETAARAQEGEASQATNRPAATMPLRPAFDAS
jgi:hypothetical protein